MSIIRIAEVVIAILIADVILKFFHAATVARELS